jgi:hypothetical protein
VDVIISKRAVDDNVDGIYNAYVSIDSSCWKTFAGNMVKKDALTANEARVIEYFVKTGAIVTKHDIPEFGSGGKTYIGFVDIFNDSKFDVYMYDIRARKFRDASKDEIEKIQTNRVHTPKPKNVSTLWGMLYPSGSRKNPDQPYVNKLKILGSGPKSQSTTGTVCDTQRKDDIVGNLRALGYDASIPAKNTKDQLCGTLALQLLKSKKMFMLPEWKPRS